MSKILKLDTKSHHILTLSGMGAFFSALFGTPIGAAVFALEVVSVGQFCSAAIFPCIVASVTAFKISTALGTHPERFLVELAPAFSLSTLWKVAVIAVLGALISIVFCKVMHYTSHYFKKLFKNEYLRILVGSALIIGLTFLLGTRDYNGGGIDVIERIFDQNTVRYEAFIIKIIFTAITIGCGFKGGEIVPTIFIGATLGATLSTILGLPLGFGAAVGIASLLCGVTNCPIATIFLSIELFGSEGVIFYTLATVTSFILSGYSSLYTGQKLFFSKLNDEIIDRNAD
jgi:H+/Cl- antiporter ClcA